jgi:hypothetical protein
MNKPLPRTTIRQMPLPHPKNKFKYCFEMSYYGSEQRAELEAWCLADPENRRWGNMGYVECNLDSDAIEFITTWGINWSKRTPKVLDKEDVVKLGYSRVGMWGK